MTLSAGTPAEGNRVPLCGISGTFGELLAYWVVVDLTPDFNSYGQRNGDDGWTSQPRLLESG